MVLSSLLLARCSATMGLEKPIASDPETSFVDDPERCVLRAAVSWCQ